MSLPAGQRLIAESNYELHQTRDPYGALAERTKTNTRKVSVFHAWEPNDATQSQTQHTSDRTHSAPEYSRARRLSMIQDQLDHSVGIHIPHQSGADIAPSKARRTLPPTPGAMRPEHDSIKAEAICPMSSAQAVHRDPDELYDEQDAKLAGPYGRTIIPLGPAPEWKGKDPKMSGLSIEERPPWVSITGEANPVFGDYIAPVLGNLERHRQQQQQFADRHFLQSLRIPEDPNVQWRMDKIRRKTMVESEADRDENMPDVFVRLMDHTRYPGAHRARFSADGIGMGIEGRRDDTMDQEVQAGNGTITRGIEPEIDAPNKPSLPWDRMRASKHAHYTKAINPNFSTADANEDHEMTHGTIGRLSSELHKTFTRDGGDYEAEQNKRAEFKVDPHFVRKWQ